MVQLKCDMLKCGTYFRANLRKPSPNLLTGVVRGRHKRLVPAFTIQALQHGTRVIPPPSANLFEMKPARPTVFRICHIRGEIPIVVEFHISGKRIGWKVPIAKLDFHHYLPIFFDGLADTKYPYTFLVQNGLKDMVAKGPQKVLPVVPQLIMPIKRALATKRPEVLCNTLKALQTLVTSCERVGEALVPYFRQILPIINLFKNKNVNIGAGIDHTTSRGENVGDLIEETLQILERYGGVDAFINIKYMVPTYESCVMN